MMSWLGERPLALHQVLRFVPRQAAAEIEIVSKKRPEVIVRRTRYKGVVVDERALTRAFAWVPRSPTLQAIALLEGNARMWSHDGTGMVQLSPGDVALLSPSDASKGRFEDATYLDLEWVPERVDSAPSITRLGRIDLQRATELGSRLVADATPDRALFADAFELFRTVGAPLGALSVEGFGAGPSEQELAIARAIAVQVANLRAAASALSFGENADLSPRQLQRVLASYFERYRMNATNWRDMRNRYRIHIAITLLSIRELSVATIADEVGYASPAALARAFAALGLPTPGKMRDDLAGME